MRESHKEGFGLAVLKQNFEKRQTQDCIQLWDHFVILALLMTTTSTQRLKPRLQNCIQSIWEKRLKNFFALAAQEKIEV